MGSDDGQVSSAGAGCGHRECSAPENGRGPDWSPAPLSVLFTARFIPFARLAVNLVAGATRIPIPRYAGLVALAAAGWATYQAAVGAVFAAILPGGPVVAIVVSVLVAIAVGALIDLVIRPSDAPPIDLSVTGPAGLGWAHEHRRRR